MLSIIGLFFPILVLYSLVAASSGTELWPMGVDHKLVIVPYVIGNGFNATQKAMIHQGLNDIENTTCVRFYIREKQPDYVYFRFSQNIGSSEGVGRVGGRQQIVLSPFGSMHKERTIHEMLHTLGFHHMHQRFDRGSHVKIFLNNVKIGSRHAFAIKQNRIEKQGTPYDFDSLLHYPKAAFSRNGKNTIVPRNINYLDRIGHQPTLSKGDALRINRLYNCPGFVRWN